MRFLFSIPNCQLEAFLFLQQTETGNLKLLLGPLIKDDRLLSIYQHPMFYMEPQSPR